jgi:hypothetical protein
MTSPADGTGSGTVMSVHVADLSLLDARRALRLFRGPLIVDGLRRAEVGRAAPLSPHVLPRPSLHRVALVADDSRHALWARGWSVRMHVLRLSGSWPTITAPEQGEPTAGGDGPVVALTLGRLRARRSIEFFRTSARAEAQLLRSPGLVWATGMGMLPFVGTCSVWRSADALEAFAYRTGTPHVQAIAADRKEPFHHVSAFVRLRPDASTGALSGANPLDAHWLDQILAPRPADIGPQ